MPSNPTSRLSLFLSFLRQNRNKTCPELTKLRSRKKNSGEDALEPSLQSWAPAEIFLGGGQAQKGPHHEVKSSKRPPHGETAPQNEKNVAKWPHMKKKYQKGPQYSEKPFFRWGGGRRPTLATPPCGRPCLQSRGFNNHCFLYKK